MSDDVASEDRDGRRRSLREIILGSRDRLGMWTLPLFVAVGLLGAVLAGSLTTVHYAGRVAALQRETAEARGELSAAVDRVSEAADEGVAAIEEEVSGVLDQLAANAPVEEPLEHGLVAVRATVVLERPPEREADAREDEQDDGSQDTGEDGTEDDGQQGGEEHERPQPRTETRYGSGFAVIIGEDETFFVTSFSVVRDPLRDGLPVERAQVLLGGAAVDARVHSWHAARDVALLRTGPVRGVRVAEWRPIDEPIGASDHLFLVGMTPRGSVVQLRSMIGGVDDEVIVADTAAPDLLRGGPALDPQGRVTAVVSRSYAPYGAGGGSGPLIPIRLLCEQLIRCGDADIGAG